MSHPFPDQARWIQSPLCGGPESGVPAPYLRTTFDIPFEPAEAILHVTALGIADFEINGRPAFDDQLMPGWTDYMQRVPYRSYDVTALMKKGANCVGAILGDGWYCGHVAWSQRQTYGERPRVRVLIEVKSTDGEIRQVFSDGTWKTATGPILQNDLLMGEAYDARLAIEGWSEAGFDDSAWPSVETWEAPPMEISAAILPPVRRRDVFDGKLIEETGGHRGAKIYRYDFGQNLAGRLRIRVQAPRGTTLTMKHAEVLKPDGSLYTDNLRTAKATDYYTCRGGGEETWEPRFTFHGFRYASIGASRAVESLSAQSVVLQTDLEPTGEFNCSHPLLNQLFKNIVWGARSNFLEIPTDCPQRDERLGWTGDAQVFVSTAAIVMDVRTFFRKWMRDLRDSQAASGQIPSFAPDLVVPPVPKGDGGPAWADAMVLCPWAIYEAYGDREILEENYAAMASYLRFIAGPECTKDGIRNHPDLKRHCYGDWLAQDGSPNAKGFSPFELIGTAFLAEDARIMEQVAGLLGRPEEEAEFKALREATRTAFQERFVTPDGLVIGATQTSYLLALAFDLLEPGSIPGAITELVRDIEKRKFHLSTGFVGTPYLLPVLEKVGRLDLAYKLMEQESFPSWLFPVLNGATTMWEHWDSWTPEKGFKSPGMNSFNHYAYGAVGTWMFRSIAGLAPAEPGYRKILFRPRPGGSLTKASARLKTAHGTIGIRWEKSGERLQLELEVPEGTEATLDLPEGYKTDATEFGPGSHKREGRPR